MDNFWLRDILVSINTLGSIKLFYKTMAGVVLFCDKHLEKVQVIESWLDMQGNLWLYKMFKAMSPTNKQTNEKCYSLKSNDSGC